ncbi:MAG TPA: beta-propeller fold lactonase family protein, partial [Armatimonadota bacterium]
MAITRRAALGGLLLGAGYALLGEDIPMASAATAQGSSPKAMRVYVGRYTWGPGAGKGIGIYRLDLASGALTPEGEAPVVDSPSFLAIHPSRKYLYAVNEVGQFQGKPQGAVTAFAVDPKDGKLTVLNQQPSGGNGPCFVTVDHSGRNALVANYGSGSIAVLPIGAAGRLGAHSSVDQHHGKGVNPQRQEGPH